MRCARALLRGHPNVMTVAVILVGLLPILLGHGAGSEVMSRIAAPMIGGMLTAPLLSTFVIPATYLLIRRRQALKSLQATLKESPHDHAHHYRVSRVRSHFADFRLRQARSICV